MDGMGNVDDNVLHLPGGTYRAATMRMFDPKTGLLGDLVVRRTHPHLKIDPPVVGRFEAGVGTFECDDTLRGMPIRVRYIWSEIEADHCAVAAGFFTRRRQVVGGELGHALHPHRLTQPKKSPASVRGASLENFVRQPGSSFSDGFVAPSGGGRRGPRSSGCVCRGLPVVLDAAVSKPGLRAHTTAAGRSRRAPARNRPVRASSRPRSC